MRRSQGGRLGAEPVGDAHAEDQQHGQEPGAEAEARRQLGGRPEPEVRGHEERTECERPAAVKGCALGMRCDHLRGAERKVTPQHAPACHVAVALASGPRVDLAAQQAADVDDIAGLDDRHVHRVPVAPGGDEGGVERPAALFELDANLGTRGQHEREGAGMHPLPARGRRRDVDREDRAGLLVLGAVDGATEQRGPLLDGEGGTERETSDARAPQVVAVEPEGEAHHSAEPQRGGAEDDERGAREPHTPRVARAPRPARSERRAGVGAWTFSAATAHLAPGARSRRTRSSPAT